MKRRINVKEEAPGVVWAPKGGYYDVDSHTTDNTFGVDDAPDGMVEAQRALEPADAEARQALLVRSHNLADVAMNELFRNAPYPGFRGVEESFRTMTDPARIESLQAALQAASE